MCWNILADELAHTHAAELYPQATDSALDWGRRLAAIVRHVTTHRPDVLCLQEVDDWSGLRTALSPLGYDGEHLQRTGGRQDGCATLWLRDRLRVPGSRSRRRPESSAGHTGDDDDDGVGGAAGGSGSAAAGGAQKPPGVLRIRMADHDLRDNVALLVHLRPVGRKRQAAEEARREAGAAGAAAGGGGRDGGAAGRGARSAKGTGTRSDMDIEDDGGDGGGGGGDRARVDGGGEAYDSGASSGTNSGGTRGTAVGGAGGDGRESREQRQQPGQRSPSSSRRGKRGRQSCEDDPRPPSRGGAGGMEGAAGAAAAAAATAALASLQPYRKKAVAPHDTPSGAAAAAAAAMTPLRRAASAPPAAAAAAAAAAAKRSAASAANVDGDEDDEGEDLGGGSSGTRRKVPSADRLPRTLRRGFWVANTHLLFNTKRGDIKLGQLRVILTELAAHAGWQPRAGEDAGVSGAGAGPAPQSAATATAASALQLRPRPRLPVVFAGDFNMAPGSGLYRYLRHGELRLGEEDRRELSGQVEGYGYQSFQRDVRQGRPTRLTRWAPPPTQPHAAPGLAAAPAALEGYQGAGPSAAGAPAQRAPYEMTAAPPYHLPYHSRDVGTAFRASRSYSVRWEMEELVYAMGKVAVSEAMAAVTAASAAGGAAASGGMMAERLPDCPASGPPQAPAYGLGSGSGRGGNSTGWQQQRPGPGPGRGQFLAAPGLVSQTAVVRHPLQLDSAYSSVDSGRREPLFTTLHARYVGTVDFVWFTPGDCPPGEGREGRAGEVAAADDPRVGSSDPGGAAGFSLVPLRVLQLPDPLAYPYGMPSADWPSDHVSLVVDFRLR